MDTKESKSKAVPIEWHIPDDIFARYATNFVVQHLEHEFLISFFEVWPPILLGEPEEIMKKVDSINSVSATCVAQIIVSANRMPDLIKVLQDNLRQYHSASTETGESK